MLPFAGSDFGLLAFSLGEDHSVLNDGKALIEAKEEESVDKYPAIFYEVILNFGSKAER